MSITYTPTTNFGSKDGLPANDPQKVVKGAEFTTEFTAIQSAFNLAAPTSAPVFTGTATFSGLTVNGAFTSRGIDDNATSTAVTISSSGRVGIGETSPSSLLHLKGMRPELTLEDTESFFSPNRVSFRNSAGTYPAEIGNNPNINGDQRFMMGTLSGYPLGLMTNAALRMTIDATGRVGIGTDNPDRSLHVSSAASAYMRLESLDTTGSVDQVIGALEFEGNDSGGAGVRANVNAIYEGTSGAAALTFGTSVDAGSATERMRIDSSGNVGIGTDSPAAPLSVADGDASFEVFPDASGNQASLQVYDRVNSTFERMRLKASDILFDVGGISASVSEAMRIDANGNVGIGVSGTLTNTLNFPNAASIGFKDTGGLFRNALQFNASSELQIGAAGAGIAAITLGPSGSEWVTVNSSGNVGIGTDSPTLIASNGKVLQITGNTTARSGQLRLSSSDGSQEAGYYVADGLVQFGAITNHPLLFRTNNTERMRIDSSGRVGIGTSIPADELHVYGDDSDVINLKVENADATGTYKYITMGYGGSGGGLPSIWQSSGYIEAPNSLVLGSFGNPMKFYTNPSREEDMRLDASGNLLVGKISNEVVSDGVALVDGGTSSIVYNAGTPLELRRAAAGTIIQFNRNGVAEGQVVMNSGAAPSFAAASDERLKDNIVDHESELANVMALRPTRWDWKDEAKGSGEGFIAQELEQTAWADLVSEGDDGFKQVAGLGAVETRLIKAIQEQQAMIEELKAEVAALKGA